MRDSAILSLVMIFLAITAILFLMNIRIGNLADRVTKLEITESVKEAKEIVSREHGTGIGIGGSSRTFIDEKVDIDTSMSHYSEPGISIGVDGGMKRYFDNLPMDTHISHGGNGRVSTTGRIDAIGGCISSRGTSRAYYHISDPGNSMIDYGMNPR